MVTLYQQLTSEEADTYSLVLSAAGIGNRIIAADGSYQIDVPEALLDAARDAVRRYQAENPPPAVIPSAGRNDPAPVPLSGIFIALVLLAVHMAVVGSSAPQDYHRSFGADARRILSGEIYRCATALVLHADATHIAGNMAGIALFGSAVCAVTGTGVGWLMILGCGMLGNWVNAWVYRSDHLSVGASTAVFGAVGILCALQSISAVRTGRGWKRVIVVAGAGAALLAFLGTGARSDIGAHLFGWLAGILVGGAYGLLMDRPPTKRGQVIGGAIAAAVLVGAWICGVVG
jgi:rhomboid protease GluP